MNVLTFDSSQFFWQNNLGVAELSDLLFTTKTWNIPNMFYVKSSKTGNEVLFKLDVDAPGYEDGWDGEYKRFTDNDSRYKVIIYNR